MRIWIVVLVLLGAAGMAMAQNMKNGLNNPTGSIVGGGGGGGGGGCAGVIDTSKGCPIPMMGM